jgi:hypothetical protein
MMRIASAVAIVAGAAVAPAAAQQAPVVWPDLPPAVALAAVELFNHPGTIRFSGETWIGHGSAIAGDVAVVGGPLHLDGAVRGSVVVINGDARIGRDATIEGRLIVIGGMATGPGVAGLDDVQIFAPPLRYQRLEGGLIELAPAGREPGLAAGRDVGTARIEATAGVRGAYNRVEGLPIAAGPRLRFRGSNPLELHGLLIYRTAPGLHVDARQVGWHVRAEQYAGGHRRAGFGVIAFSEIVPIARNGLSEREASLAAFILHRDFRDHYERQGWSAFGWLGHRYRPTELRLEFSDAAHRTVPAAAPWSLLRNDEPWRPQPAIADGRLRALTLAFAHDSRNERITPSTGWLASLAVEQGLGGSLRYGAVLTDTGVVAPVDLAASPHFTALSADVRRYVRLGPNSRLATRVYGAGAIHAGTLPPQRQVALGGEGSLPGYRLFRFDCGARSATFEARGAVFFPAYGCDRAVLVQLEHHGAFPYARRLLAPLGAERYVGDAFGWVVFFDAGRAWTDAEERSGRTRGQDDFAADAGLGVRLGHVGVYWVLPLSGTARGINFFVRLGPRI